MATRDKTEQPTAPRPLPGQLSFGFMDVRPAGLARPGGPREADDRGEAERRGRGEAA